MLVRIIYVSTKYRKEMRVMSAITQEFLAHVDLARLQRAARGLQDGSLDVVVEGQTRAPVEEARINGKAE